jgi:uncharacterized protein (DUF2252 family)
MDGKALRAGIPRSAHAGWKAPADRDPGAILEATFATLAPELVPVRIKRMSASPFGYYRGSAGVMAADLATLPKTGMVTQISGDAHLSNFGGYASPERRLVFDVNDFDETVLGPWEWDVKRLAASVPLAGRERGLRPQACEAATRYALATYRDRMALYATMPSLDVWYASIELSGAVRTALDARTRREWEQTARLARRRTAITLLPRITEGAGEGMRFIEDPPLLTHHGVPDEPAAYGRRVIAAYRATLRHEAQILIDRFTVVDMVRKVVGVGSVGTWCTLILLVDAGGNPLLLQAKEARASALEPFVGEQVFATHGERVVGGQRMMQASSDALLGWAVVDDRCIYVRQDRDMKAAPDLASLAANELQDYAGHCAWALARAHARTGDPRGIATYIGRSDVFVDAIAEFAKTYARQAEHDHAAFVERFGSGG